MTRHHPLGSSSSRSKVAPRAVSSLEKPATDERRELDNADVSVGGGFKERSQHPD